MMAVFNNLVLSDQHVAQNSLETIVPDLVENWSWNAGRRHTLPYGLDDQDTFGLPAGLPR